MVLLMASSRRSNWQEMARDRTTIGRLSELLKQSKSYNRLWQAPGSGSKALKPQSKMSPHLGKDLRGTLVPGTLGQG